MKRARFNELCRMRVVCLLGALFLLAGLTAGCGAKKPPEDPPFEFDGDGDGGGSGDFGNEDEGSGSGAGGGVTESDLDEIGGYTGDRGPVGGIRSGEGAWTIEALDTVYFDYDRSNVRDDMVGSLEKNLDWILDNRKWDILIEGHCDERGTDAYNLALGERRALAVRAFLMERGVAGERLRTISYGESQPASLGTDEGAWKLNRRAEFKVLLPPGENAP